jgi:hypothetical protein
MKPALTSLTLHLDVEAGVEAYEEHAVNRYSDRDTLLRLDYTDRRCCSWCAEQAGAEALAEWIAYLRAQEVYPPRALTLPIAERTRGMPNCADVPCGEDNRTGTREETDGS